MKKQNKITKQLARIIKLPSQPIGKNWTADVYFSGKIGDKSLEIQSRSKGKYTAVELGYGKWQEFDTLKEAEDWLNALNRGGKINKLTGEIIKAPQGEAGKIKV